MKTMNVILKRPNRRFFVIPGFMIIVGFLALLTAALYFIQALIFQTTAVETVGTVYESYTEQSSDASEYEMRYFYTVDGKLYEDSRVMGRAQVSEGTVRVFYIPDNPGNHRIAVRTGAARDFGGNIMVTVLALIIVAGGIFGLLSYPKNVKI